MIQSQYIYNNQGKSILIIGGLHGNQHTSILACQLLNKQFASKKIKNIKKIKVCNFVNYTGIFNNTRQDQNNIDLNRQFDLVKKSSNADIQKIKKYIAQFDVIIDVHSSFNTTQFCYLAKDKFTKSYMLFLDQLNIKYVISTSNESTLKNFVNLNTTKIAFTIQLNQNGNDIDYNSAYRGVQIIKQIITNIDLCQKTPDIFQNIQEAYDICADITGKVKIDATLGKTYKKGQSVGRIQSLDGKNIISITVPEDGIAIVYPIKQAYVSIGLPLIRFQRIN